jgi:hypothetical protein
MNETRDTLRRLRIYVLIIVALIVWGSMSPHMQRPAHQSPTTHHREATP